MEDPSLFRMDWEVLAEVLAAIVVLSFFIERALSLLFESTASSSKASPRRA